MNRYHDENMEWFRNLKPVRNDHDEIKQKRNIFAMILTRMILQTPTKFSNDF